MEINTALVCSNEQAKIAHNFDTSDFLSCIHKAFAFHIRNAEVFLVFFAQLANETVCVQDVDTSSAVTMLLQRCT